MKNMTKIALLATCAGLLTACGGGSDNPAMGGGGEPDPDTDTPTLEQRLAAQNDLIDQARSARRTAMMRARSVDALDDSGEGKAEADVLAGTEYDTAQGRSAVVRLRTQEIIGAYDDMHDQLVDAHNAVMELHRISEDESLTDEEREIADNILGNARYSRNQIQILLGYKEGGYDDETVRRVLASPDDDQDKSALRQAYVSIVGDETDMLKVVADREKKAADAVWEALERGLMGLESRLGALDRNIEEGIAFAVSDKPDGAMTFEDIAGNNLASVDINNLRRKAVSVEGWLRKDVTGDGGKPSEKNKYDYNGIAGHVVCRMAEGSCDAPKGETLGEGWYFVPNRDDHKSYFFMKDGKYEQRLIVRYGMWLREGEGENPSVLAGRIRVDNDLGRDNGKLDITSVNRATYTGDAEGLAARKHGTEMATGQFGARVIMSASFGPDPELSGYVHDFKPVNPELDGEAVDTDWRVDLFHNNLMPDATATGNNWTATGFGENAKRPDGFYGGFHHTFKDDDDDDTGRVAGVYVAHQD